MAGSIIGAVAGKALGGLMGGDDAGDAAAAQGKAADKSVEFQKEALKQIRGDLQPYRDAGSNILYGGEQYDQDAFEAAQRDFWAMNPAGSKTNKKGKIQKGKGFLDLAGYQALSPEERAKYTRNDKGQFVYKAPTLQDFKLNPTGGLLDLITKPEEQLKYVQNNPFFEAMAKKSTDTLLANQAARGKLGSGGTAEALQNSLLLLGNDLLNQNIGQRQNIANMGAAAAAQTANATQNNANSISDLYTQKGNAQAAGIMGASNAANSAAAGISGFNLGGFGGGGGFVGGPSANTGQNFGSVLWK